MTFIWNESLATGIDIIDTQHKQLFAAINDLLDTCKKGQGQLHLESSMQFLIRYTHKHFDDEEKLQQQYHYPDFINHKKMHDSFKSTIEELAKELKKEGPTTLLITKITSSTGEWLRNHIQQQDKKVAGYIHA